MATLGWCRNPFSMHQTLVPVYCTRGKLETRRNSRETFHGVTRVLRPLNFSSLGLEIPGQRARGPWGTGTMDVRRCRKPAFTGCGGTTRTSWLNFTKVPLTGTADRAWHRTRRLAMRKANKLTEKGKYKSNMESFEYLCLVSPLREIEWN